MAKLDLLDCDRQAGPPKPCENEDRSGKSKPSVGEVGARILLIDRKPLSRHCLVLWLQGLEQCCSVSAISDPKEIASTCRSPADVDLIVYAMGERWCAEVASNIDRIIQDMSPVPLVLLSDGDDIDDILDAIERGVRGYIPTTLEEKDAAEAIRFIRSGGTFVPAHCLVRPFRPKQEPAQPSRPVAGNDLAERLTPRETEVLVLLRQGNSNKAIARELAISPSTVKVFVRQILLKLHANNRTEVAFLTQGAFEDASLSRRA